ncbi:hypothetical protein BSIN_4347 [Burkholderia singularis]|uniref:Uncharacterized protein n=1 Tax=Burkholderia singularis TaxID=1503053 RepID=A0A238H881_9BURK|nr:hypothetical protein BSIN_4347 [Burkholderia singularis]
MDAGACASSAWVRAVCKPVEILVWTGIVAKSRGISQRGHMRRAMR